MANAQLDDFLSSCGVVDFADKATRVNEYVRYMLCRTQSMFKYSGLPSTIPQRDLELMLQSYGVVTIAKVEGDLYAFRAGYGGMPDPYYIPTIATIANPALNYSAQLKIGSECEIIRGDSLTMGLLPLFNKYASMLTENDLTLKFAMVNSRVPAYISCEDDATKTAAEKYLADIEKGKLGVIASKAFLDSIKVHQLGNSGRYGGVVDFIELEQYIKATWFGEIGLKSNYNMKREALNGNETHIDDDILSPLVDDMLRNRRQGLDRVNTMFGTSISVELAGTWADNEREVEAEIRALESEDATEEVQES